VIPNGQTMMKITHIEWKSSPTPANKGRKSDDTRHFRPNIRIAGMALLSVQQNEHTI